MDEGSSPVPPVDVQPTGKVPFLRRALHRLGFRKRGKVQKLGTQAHCGRICATYDPAECYECGYLDGRADEAASAEIAAEEGYDSWRE